MKSILPLIKSRRSIRDFKKTKISEKIIKNILEAGRWAPSGLNNQPWRFAVLAGADKDRIAGYTKYAYIIKRADTVILVFLDKHASYHHEKDLMAIGASIQNMLLYIHSQKLGACWLGEIVNKSKEISACLQCPSRYIFVAAVAVGYPRKCPKSPRRAALRQLLAHKVIRMS